MKNHSKTAFPFMDADEHHYQTGMTLRDWFAGMAIQGLLAQERNIVVSDTLIESDMVRLMAASAYEMADALMKAREE